MGSIPATGSELLHVELAGAIHIRHKCLECAYRPVSMDDDTVSLAYFQMSAATIVEIRNCKQRLELDSQHYPASSFCNFKRATAMHLTACVPYSVTAGR